MGLVVHKIQCSAVGVDAPGSDIEDEAEKLVDVNGRIHDLARVDQEAEAVDLGLGRHGIPIEFLDKRLVHGAESDRHIRQKIVRELDTGPGERTDLGGGEGHDRADVHRFRTGGAGEAIDR